MRHFEALLFGILAFASAMAVQAVEVDEGDLIVVAPDQFVVIHIDRDTGVQSRVASAGLLECPYGVRVRTPREVFVSDCSADAVFRVDATAFNPEDPEANQALVWSAPSSAGSLLRDLELGPDGDLFVEDSATDTVYRVDPESGTDVVVASGGLINRPQGLAIDADGQLLMTSTLNQLILQIDPGAYNPVNLPANQTVVASGGHLETSAAANGIAVGADGAVYVAAYGVSADLDKIVRIDPDAYDPQNVLANQTVVASAGEFFNPAYLAVDESGDLFLSDFAANRVYRVDPDAYDPADPSSNQTLASQPSDIATSLRGIAIVPEPNAGLLHLAALTVLVALAGTRRRRAR